jgi:hypothetical protein
MPKEFISRKGLGESADKSDSEATKKPERPVAYKTDFREIRD